MKKRPFSQVDVFTAVPYLGNPLAVVLDGSGLSTEQMQAFTDWTNLSEATFVLPAVTRETVCQAEIGDNPHHGNPLFSAPRPGLVWC